jgi:hypothetical protein
VSSLISARVAGERPLEVTDILSYLDPVLSGRNLTTVGLLGSPSLALPDTPVGIRQGCTSGGLGHPQTACAVVPSHI